MKYLNFICYSLLLMLLFNTSSLYAAPPLEDHTLHTPLSLMPEPLSGSRDTLKLAATWWLPDWQGSQGSRGSDDIGGGDIVKDDSDCMKHYNLYATCPSPKLSTGVVHPVAGMTCQKSCYCPSEYKYTSSNCSGNYTVSGGSCDGKYNDCVCKSEYSQNSSNCNGEYRPAGESCEGNYNRCEMRPECTVSSMSCTYGCAGYNSCDRCTSCKSNPDCDVSDKSCGSLGCASYNSCSKCTSCNTDPCSGVSCGSNAYCSGGSCYCNSGYKKCNGSCISNSSCCGGCSSNQTCQNGSCVTNTPSCSDTCPSYPYSSPSSCSYDYDSCYDTCGGKTWYKCISAPADPCSGVSCGSNAYCSGGSCYCNSGYHKSGSSCVKDEVHSHSYSCPSGYSSSNSWGSCVTTTSKTCSCGATSGNCYKNKCSGSQICSSGTCRTPSCSPYLSSIPANKICDTVTKDGLTCYNNCSYYYTGSGTIQKNLPGCARNAFLDYDYVSSPANYETRCDVSNGTSIQKCVGAGMLCRSTTYDGCESCRSSIGCSCPSAGTRY